MPGSRPHSTSAEAPALAKDLQPLLTEGASTTGTQGANALIVTDAQENFEALQTIISSLDKGAGNAEWRSFHLKHLPAKGMADIITDVFKQITPRALPAPMGPPGPPQPPLQPGAKPQVSGAVAAVPDDRSNSVMVVGSVVPHRRRTRCPASSAPGQGWPCGGRLPTTSLAIRPR